MLKKCLAILVLLVYLPAIAGVGFSSHFCDGNHKETRVFSFSKQSCCCGEPAAAGEDDGCCSDEIKLVKLDNDQRAAADSRVDFKPFEFKAPVSFQALLMPAGTVRNTIVAASRFSDPPPLSHTKIHILFRSIII